MITIKKTVNQRSNKLKHIDFFCDVDVVHRSRYADSIYSGTVIGLGRRPRFPNFSWIQQIRMQ